MKAQVPQKGHKPSKSSRLYTDEYDWLEGMAENNKLKSQAEALALIHKMFDRTAETRITEKFTEFSQQFAPESEMKGVIEVMRVITIKAFKHPEYRETLKERLEKVL